MTIEKTFAMIKPDGLRRSLSGTILQRFENAGLTIVGLKMLQPTKKQAEEHYKEHVGRSFYKPLVDLLLSGPVIAIVLEGTHAVIVTRKLVGATEPLDAAPGTIRGDYCHMSYKRAAEKNGVIHNLVHASDSHESGVREINIWFDKKEMYKPERSDIDEF